MKNDNWLERLISFTIKEGDIKLTIPSPQTSPDFQEILPIDTPDDRPISYAALANNYFNDFNLLMHQYYKADILNSEFDLAKQFAERYWPSEDRSSPKNYEIAFQVTHMYPSYDANGARDFSHIFTQEFYNNYLKLSDTDMTSIYESSDAVFNALEKQNIRHSVKNNSHIAKRTHSDNINKKTAETFNIRSMVIKNLLSTGELPKDYIQRIFKEIIHIDSEYAECLGKKQLRTESIKGLKRIQKMYSELIMREKTRTEIYRYIGRQLEKLSSAIKEYHILGMENNQASHQYFILKQLDQAEKRINMSKIFRPLEINTTLESKIREREHIYNSRLDLFYDNEAADDSIRRIFNKKDIKILLSLKKDPGCQSILKDIIRDGVLYKKNIEQMMDRMKFSLDKKIVTFHKTIPYNMINAGLETQILNSAVIYEKDSSTNLQNQIQYYKTNMRYVRTGPEMKNNLEKMRAYLQSSQVLNLKLLQFIKKKAVEMKETDFAFKIQELESMLSYQITHNRVILDDDTTLSFGKRQTREEYDAIKKISRSVHFTNTKDVNLLQNYDPIQDKYSIHDKIFSFDCLAITGKYESQGWTLANNTQSCIINISSENSKTSYTQTNMARIFLYNEQNEAEKCLFIAGLSGSHFLNNFKRWSQEAVKIIIEIAQKNNYEKIYFNINPIGDIRNPVTRYSHEFAKSVADLCQIQESEYTYEKLGSGRKPKFFQLTREAKEKYTKHIRVSRDPDLIGTFFVEGMFGTKEEAVNSRISLNPEKDNFKPYFFESEGYAPVIEYKIR